jgi:hypothetical protein
MTASTWTLPASLSPPLSTREAIADALYRSVAGLDTPDPALFESAHTQDATFEINGRVIDGMKDIIAQIYDPTARLDTTHFITNVRIHVADAASEAKMSASGLAQHYRPGTGREAGATRYMTGSSYFIDLVKDDKDGLWKIKKFQMKATWSEGDRGVITGN